LRAIRDAFELAHDQIQLRGTLTMRPKISIALCALAATAAHAQTTNSYTLSDVALHATAADCWMVLNSTKVYNVTPFLSVHPAGAAVMLPYCGKDGTPGFASVPHSSNAVALEATYLIGTLVTAPAAISVTLTPANATLAVGGTVQLTAKVANSTAGVAWSVSPSTLGTISASGLFTATAAGQGTVTAASTQDSTKSASALVTVSSVVPSTGTITVALSPSALTLEAGARHHFTAQVTHATQGVTWSVKGSIGTIDRYGVFTAAMTPGTGAVVATSINDPTKTATAQVTVTATMCTPARQGRDD
jgi:cytochrome b involved in lipid metabolism